MANLTWDVSARDRGATATFGKVSTAMQKAAVAANKIEDAQLKLSASTLRSREAALSLARAQEHLTKVSTKAGATDREKNQAALAVQRAQLNSAKATRDAARATDTLNTSVSTTTNTTEGLTRAHHRVREATDQSGRSTRSFSQVLGSLSTVSNGAVGAFKLLGVGIAAGVAAAGVGLVLLARYAKGWVAEAREAVAVGKQTAAVIKSTGGAANISAAQVGKLAESLSAKVGVDDEVIQSSANLLLTFKGVRNEVGHNNDIFNQAAGVIVDMTAAMNKGAVTSQGLKSATIQVGKALNDPIKGVTALTKVGVTFTAEQKKQIKSLTEHGRTLDAQKIILKELTSEFAGSAVAAADPMRRLGVIFGNIKEQLGVALLPYLNDFSVWLGDTLPGAVGTGLRWLGNVRRSIGLIIESFKDGDVTSSGFNGAMERIGSKARDFYDALSLVVGAFRDGDVTSNGFNGALERIGAGARTAFNALKAGGQWVLDNWQLIAQGLLSIAAAVTAIKTASLAFSVIQGVLGAIANPAALIAGALVAIAAGFVLAYQRSAEFRTTVNSTLSSFGQWINENKLTFALWGTTIAQWTIKIGGYLLIMAGGWLKSAGLMIGGFSSVLKAVISVAGGILFAMTRAFGWIPGVGDKLRAAEASFNQYKTKVTDALDATAEGAGAAGDKLTGLGQKALTAADSVGRVREKVSNLRDRQITLTLLDKITGRLGPIQRQIDSVTGKAVSIQPGQFRGSGRIGASKGGIVTGGVPGVDSVPALLMPGERVLTRQEAHAYNLRLGGNIQPAGRSGGNTYAITVNVAPGGHPAEVGAAMVQAIREFERRSGTGWRQAG